MQRTLWYVVAILFCSIANSSLGAPDKPKPAVAHKEKLVVILLDG
jgi:hypothetical protein